MTRSSSNWLPIEPNSLLHDRVVWFDRHGVGQKVIFVRHLHIAHNHEFFWRPTQQSRQAARRRSHHGGACDLGDHPLGFAPRSPHHEGGNTHLSKNTLSQNVLSQNGYRCVFTEMLLVMQQQSRKMEHVRTRGGVSCAFLFMRLYLRYCQDTGDPKRFFMHAGTPNFCWYAQEKSTVST